MVLHMSATAPVNVFFPPLRLCLLEEVVEGLLGRNEGGLLQEGGMFSEGMSTGMSSTGGMLTVQDIRRSV